MIQGSERRILYVTGGLGFIGKHFVHEALKQGHYVINVDMANYSADIYANGRFRAFRNYHYIESDIVDLDYLPECDFIINFAAESHVDNSISSADKFCRTNFLGVQRLVDLSIQKRVDDRPVFIQISTDEVYGDIVTGRHNEGDILMPSNPYSATKAAADLLVLSYHRTHKLNFNILRPSNNYGHYQYPEKLIPKSILRMKRGLPALMHGDGSFVRSWLHVMDTVEAIFGVIKKGKRNDIYNICGDVELTNIQVLEKIAAIIGVDLKSAWLAVENRAGQDVRYSMDDSKLRKLGWAPTRDFDQELAKIVASESFSLRFLSEKDSVASEFTDEKKIA